MTRITQPGIHPDAESLNAFVEQALPLAEREQILAHLASCDRCREVIFLAQETAGAETEARAIAVSAKPAHARAKWFAGWRWAWVPATALAGTVGLAVLYHYQSASSQIEVAQIASQPPAPTSASTDNQPLPSPDSRRFSNVRDGVAASPPVSKDLPVTAKKKSESGDREAAVRDSNKTAEEKEAVAIAQSQLQAQLSRGEIRPAQKPSGIASQHTFGGPYAANNAYQQQASNQQEIAQDQLHSARYSAKAASVGGAAETTADAGKAEPQNQIYPAAAAPTRQVAVREAAKGSLAAAAGEAPLDKKTIVVLPNGMRALSVATAQGRTVALDPSGSLFLSEAPGGQWMPVAMQWRGHAVLIRTHQTEPKAKAPSQPLLFELVNDVNEAWVSPDGKTWTPKDSSPE